MGYAHSVECWHEEDLVGGLYGVALGKVFYGESMFAELSNSSKIALVYLVNHLKAHDFQLIDCQMTTEHLLQFGGREISGKHFQAYLERYISTLLPDGVWSNDPDA
jgi:leucyl/phenylalanyl-tRNA--protein transferase